MRYLLSSVFAVLLGMALTIDTAGAASITGAWRGNGLVKLTSGKAERIRCRIRYEEGSGRTFVVHVSCAHAHGTFQTSGRVVKLSNTRYTGRLYSEQHDVAGDVSISVNGRKQHIKATSSKGSATVTLTRQ
ncbi:MAG: hypothetical protein MPJ78_11770 [Hyphomicrobiaceae bacterium]|nr:hypothetical protein [Hyphomicrobiaceae bacterium]